MYSVCMYLIRAQNLTFHSYIKYRFRSGSFTLMGYTSCAVTIKLDNKDPELFAAINWMNPLQVLQRLCWTFSM